MTLRGMAERVARVGDVWAELHRHAHALAPALERLRALLSEADWEQSRAAATRKPRARKRRAAEPR